MKEKTSLFKMTPKSLTDTQTKEVFSKFISIAKELGVHELPQVVFVTNKTKTRISYKYRQQSRMSPREPEFSVEVVSSCQGLEKVQLVRAYLNNCGLCHGAGSAEITQRKFKQIENVLKNAFDLFKVTYEEYRSEDLKQLKFDGVVDSVKKASKHKEIKTKKNGWTETETYIGKITGDVKHYRDSQTFGFELSGLTPQQAIKIGEVISSL